MKKKIFFIFILFVFSILFINLNEIKANSITPTDIVTNYYNSGVYTKKTEIFLTEETINEFKEYFHVNATSDRTTYYSGSYLLMGDFDGGFDEVNSGFRTDGNNMKHFTYHEGSVVDDYTVTGTNIHDYFVMLDDMMEGGYFDNFTKVTDYKYTYTISSNENGIETKLHDFLWFSAPGLEDSIFNNKDSSNYFSQEGITLVLEEKTHPYYGEYLSIRILLSVLDSRKVNNDELILSEARVYKGNISFNEDDNLELEFNVKWVDEDGTILESDVCKYGTLPCFDGEIPTKEGNAEFSYTFAGWDKEVVGATKDEVYTAIYKETVNTYTVTWNLGGGKWSDGTTENKRTVLPYGELPTSPETPSKEGYTFAGWNPTISSVAGEVTYTAKWNANTYTYTILYKSNSGKNLGGSSKTATFGSTVEVGARVINGYTTPVNQWITFDSVNDKTITFVYTPTSYSITYSLDGGTSTNVSSYNIETPTFTLTHPIKTGYKFVGWIGSNGTSVQENVTINIGSTGDKAYTAIYINENIYYSSFGAKADGNTNDFEALYKTHAYANAMGAKSVIATNNKTYYISNTVPTASLLEWANAIINKTHTTSLNSSCIYGANVMHVNSNGLHTDCHGNIVTNNLITYINNNLSIIKSTSAITITIQTNVNWGNSKFIIDDTNITSKVINGTTAINNSDQQYNKDIFTVLDASYVKTVDLSRKYNLTMTDSEFISLASSYSYLSNLNTQIQTEGINESTSKLNLSLGYKAMIIIINENLSETATRKIAGNTLSVGSQRIYIRYGGNANSGTNKREVILIDENGNIDPSTPIMYDYTRIVKVEIHDLRVPTLTISGGEFTTLACREDSQFSINADGSINHKGTTITANYICRGIKINRSNTIIDGVKHYISNEYTINDDLNGLQGAHYNGFYNAVNCANVTIDNCVLTARRNYNVSGTYGYTATLVAGIYLMNCTQSNFWITLDSNNNIKAANRNDSGAILGISISSINNKKYLWGVGGSNFCKNMEFHNSTLSRFDAHQGLYNGKIINSTVSHIAIIGMGDMIVEDSEILSPGTWSENAVIALRTDYGSTWKGDIYLKGVTGTSYNNLGYYILVSYQYTNHYFGYDCYLPNLHIEDFTITNKNKVNTIYLYHGFGTSSTNYASSMHKETLYDGTTNLNVINMPNEVTIDDTAKYDYTLLYANSGESFENVKTPKCTITWNVDGTTSTTLCGYGKTPTYNGTPKKDGYTFAGWSPSLNAVTKDTTYTATWTKNYTYTIVYKSSTGKYLGGSSKTAAYGSTVEVGARVIDGYTTPVNQMVTFDSTSDKTITFIYTPITYTITYTLNGGSATNVATYNVETPSFTLTNPTRTGYTFAGWTGSNGTTPQKAITINIGSTGNKSYTANWTANTYTYTIKYVSNTGQTLGWSSKTAKFGSTVEVGARVIEGYTTPANQMVTFDSVEDKLITFVYTPIS